MDTLTGPPADFKRPLSGFSIGPFAERVVRARLDTLMERARRRRLTPVEANELDSCDAAARMLLALKKARMRCEIEGLTGVLDLTRYQAEELYLAGFDAE